MLIVPIDKRVLFYNRSSGKAVTKEKKKKRIHEIEIHLLKCLSIYLLSNIV